MISLLVGIKLHLFCIFKFATNNKDPLYTKHPVLLNPH